MTECNDAPTLNTLLHLHPLYPHSHTSIHSIPTPTPPSTLSTLPHLHPLYPHSHTSIHPIHTPTPPSTLPTLSILFPFTHPSIGFSSSTLHLLPPQIDSSYHVKIIDQSEFSVSSMVALCGCQNDQKVCQSIHFQPQLLL